MIKIFCVFLIAGLLPVSSLSVSQRANEIDKSLLPETIVQLTPAEQRAQHLKETFPQTQLRKHTLRSDAHRYLFQHEGKPLKVTAYNDGRFKIQWTREFDGRDIDELADAHPDLLKYVADVPDSTENNATVKVKIETEVTYQFDDESELEREQGELYAIYCGFKIIGKHH